MSFNKILVPIDFSHTSMNALDTAIAIAGRHQSKIVLINVVETSFYFGLPGEIMVSDSYTGDILNVSKEMVLHQKEKITAEYGIPCDGISVKGFAPSAIVKASIDQNADLIVMGSHGVSGFREFFMGSNAYKVVQHAACPVLTIPPGRPWTNFRKILFPVRPLPGAIEKYETVRKLILENKATLEILGLMSAGSESEKVQVTDLTTQLQMKLKEDQVSAHVSFYKGKDMAKGVLKKSNEGDLDMILITAFLEPSVKRFFLSAYTQQIINHARVPVFSVRPELRYEEANSNAENLALYTAFPAIG